jgi:hypothetical protein
MGFSNSSLVALILVWAAFVVGFGGVAGYLLSQTPLFKRFARGGVQ